MKEIWIGVTDAIISQEVSNYGRYRVKGKVREPAIGPQGYRLISVRGTTVCLHQAVMAAFVGPRPAGEEVCHYDGDKLNNHLDNLRYDTHQSNMQDMRRKGTEVHGDLEYCPRDHRRIPENIIPSRGRWGDEPCLACSRARALVQTYPLLDVHLKDVADTVFDCIVAREYLWGDIVPFLKLKYPECFGLPGYEDGVHRLGLMA